MRDPFIELMMAGMLRGGSPDIASNSFVKETRKEERRTAPDKAFKEFLNDMLDMIIKKEGTDSKPGATASLLRHLDKLSELEIAVRDFADPTVEYPIETRQAAIAVVDKCCELLSQFIEDNKDN